MDNRKIYDEPGKRWFAFSSRGVLKNSLLKKHKKRLDWALKALSRRFLSI